MNAPELIHELEQFTRKHLGEVETLFELTAEQLNWRAEEGSWSILECIEHLNRYGDFYLPEIEQSMKTGNRKQPAIFKTGWLGNYFAKSMLPKEKLNKMKTFKNMNPQGSQLDRSVINKFKGQLETMLKLLDAAKEVDLTRTKTGISISNWIKLRLGDTFRVVIYHHERHLVQVKRVLSNSPAHTTSVSA